MSRVIAVGLVCLVGTGCNTVANLEGREGFGLTVPSRPPVPFGGVWSDVRIAAVGLTHPLAGDGVLVFTTAALVDFPFSLVGDVVTLPWVLMEGYKERMHPTGKYQLFPMPVIPFSDANPGAEKTAGGPDVAPAPIEPSVSRKPGGD